MSTESFKTFLATVQHDATLRSELRVAGGEAGMSLEAVVAFAAGKGHAFSVEDIEDLSSITSELTDDQLAAVAAGGDPIPGVDVNLGKNPGGIVRWPSLGTVTGRP